MSRVAEIVDSLSHCESDDKFQALWLSARKELLHITNKKFITYFEGSFVIQLPRRPPPWYPSAWCKFGNPTPFRTNRLEPFNHVLKDLADARDYSVLRAAQFFYKILLRSEALGIRSSAGLDRTPAQRRRAGHNSATSVYVPYTTKNGNAHPFITLTYSTYTICTPHTPCTPCAHSHTLHSYT